MGHLLSKEASSLSRDRDRDRRCRRGRKVPPRSRSCFLRGPCMLCFIVHSASPPAPEQPLPAGDPLLPPAPYAALATAEQRATRRLLRLPPAAWEPRGRCQRLLLSGLLPPPVRSLLGPARPPGEVASEMVCKRKGAGLPACPPCKQPRCAASAAAEEPEAAACQCPGEAQLCALPAADSCAAGGGGTPARDAAGDSGGGGQPASPPPPAPEEKEEGEKEKEKWGEAGCEEPLEHPGDCCREPLAPPAPDINQLPPSILLKVGRGGRAYSLPAGSPGAGPAPGVAAGVPVSLGGVWEPPAAAAGPGAARGAVRCPGHRGSRRARSPGVWELNRVVGAVVLVCRCKRRCESLPGGEDGQTRAVNSFDSYLLTSQCVLQRRLLVSLMEYSARGTVTVFSAPVEVRPA